MVTVCAVASIYASFVFLQCFLRQSSCSENEPAGTNADQNSHEQGGLMEVSGEASEMNGVTEDISLIASVCESPRRVLQESPVEEHNSHVQDKHNQTGKEVCRKRPQEHTSLCHTTKEGIPVVATPRKFGMSMWFHYAGGFL